LIICKVWKRRVRRRTILKPTLATKDGLSTSWPGLSRPSTSLTLRGFQDVDARHISTFTRVFDALWPGMTESSNARISIGLRPKKKRPGDRPGRSEPCLSGSLTAVAEELQQEQEDVDEVEIELEGAHHRL